MSALPASPRIAIGEKIYQKIVSLCAHYNGGEDPGIVMRGWDASLKALIDQKLSKLGICVLVCAPKRKPLQEHGGTNAAILTTKIVIESNPVLKKSDATAVLGWDADDLADLLAIGLDGYREPSWLTYLKLKVTSTESSRVQMTNKAVTITVEQTAILKHGN
jgi:hypothetical protein